MNIKNLVIILWVLVTFLMVLFVVSIFACFTNYFIYPIFTIKRLIGVVILLTVIDLYRDVCNGYINNKIKLYEEKYRGI